MNDKIITNYQNDACNMIYNTKITIILQFKNFHFTYDLKKKLRDIKI